ncbi:MAG: oxidoreductase [Alphaproteobacteria bacterium HGW-Alphaproteobacteria-12]|nr:MAG: oxidoreductase [Alphaproteobacteria bacterium HGW-Alphaproteobacteria-12]
MSEPANYAPDARTYDPVCEPHDLCFAVAHMDHVHIYEMANSLVKAGATCTHVFEPDEEKVALLKSFLPEVVVATTLDEILGNPKISLVVSAAVPNLRGALGIQVMQSDKDFFTDKTPFTTIAQLDEARRVALETGRKYSVFYSERLQNEAAEFAAELVRQNVIGDVIQVIGLGPHRLHKHHRPDWFFRKEQYGGILCDIGSHQAEQFLTYTGASNASVSMARVANVANPDVPELEDFGEFSLVGSNGASGYFRMDWLTPDGLRTWGDGRTTILGTKGYIECRKYIDIAAEAVQENNVYIVTDDVEEKHNVTGKIGFPFFPAFVLDCLNRTERAMSQAHTFKAAELCLLAQQLADAR